MDEHEGRYVAVRTTEVFARLDAAAANPDAYFAIIAGLDPGEIREAWSVVLLKRRPARFPAHLDPIVRRLEDLRAGISGREAHRHQARPRP